ncbi:MAG: hypothetical protein JSV91_09180 [Phycisphaerales bacterium]|nr:MAG: hypothetical protein JSV91_09180 [Phycisphaerales bacterium]
MLTILLFLVLGVVMSVAVSWSIAHFTPRPEGYHYSDWDAEWATETPPLSTLWYRAAGRNSYVAIETIVYDKDDYPVRIIRSDHFQAMSRLPSWSTLRPEAAVEAWQQSTDFRRFTEIATGWPMLALSGRFDRELFPGNSPKLRYALPFGDHAFLPLRPIWPGAAVNTVFYAALLWLLLAMTPRAARRYLRRRYGLCPNCEYDLRGNPDGGCPECGWNREAGGAV